VCEGVFALNEVHREILKN